MKEVTIKGKKYNLPQFLPDATRGFVKSLDTSDVTSVNLQGMMVNTYHLIENPGLEVIEHAGGIKKYMNFDGLVSSDSGGWQMFSLIHRNTKAGKIEDEGVTFKFGNGKKGLVTPEDIIRAQFKIGSDIIICLDDFSPPEGTIPRQKESVIRTIRWAKRSKEEFNKQLDIYGYTSDNRPFLLAVIQGGYSKELRKQCAEELIKIGFDAYGFGGYVVDKEGNLDLDISKYIADLIPNDAIKFALGVGRISDIYNLAKMGWDIFDCTLPTRDARHKRLYILNEAKDNCDYLYLDKTKHATNFEKIDATCDCLTCKNYTISYLNHLFSSNDTLAYRLASIHNLRTYTRLIESLR